MPAPPQSTPVPPPVFMQQPSSADPPVTASSAAPEADFKLPKLRLEIRDVMSPGAKAFLKSVVPSTALEFAVRQVLALLYQHPQAKNFKVPGTRSVTLVVRSMPGVAYTTGIELDDDHKEIHFSAEYIEQTQASRKADEILGVLTHEMVHCYQYNGKGSCPGGLIEGIADWVRLNSGLSPPHWKQEFTGKWDAGYHHTAYFLEYIEGRYGEGSIRKMNEKLRVEKYVEKSFWTELVGRPVDQLWSDYGKELEKQALKTPSTSNLDA